MEATTFVDIVKKHGVTGLLCICLLWMNNRLSSVEERLYDCLDDKSHMISDNTKEFHRSTIQLAIIPDRLKIKKDGIKRKTIS